MLRSSLLVTVVSLAAAFPAAGQEWARKMFKDTSHDFGTVARAAKAEFLFEFSNLYLEDVHVSNVRSSCGCTSVRVENPSLKTYEKSAIVATFNTKSFQGSRRATLTVTFDKPFYAEVQLQVTGVIRTDVVLDPGSVQLGTLEQGTPAECKVAVNYAGRSDWKIVEVRSPNPHLRGEVVERSRSGGQVGYELVVRLDNDAPLGYLGDYLLLVTNDYQPLQIPVAVEGRISASVTVSPASLFLGVVAPGQTVTKQLVVKAAKPFRIVSIACDDKSFSFETAGADVPKTLHLVPVTFTAGENAGKVSNTIRIETDMGQCRPELSAYAVVGK